MSNGRWTFYEVVNHASQILIIRVPLVHVNAVQDPEQVIDYPWTISPISLRDKGVFYEPKELHFSVNLTIT